jgi:phosphoglucomutase
VSSGLIDRVVQRLRRHVCEVPVGFKWLVPVLFDPSHYARIDAPASAEQKARLELPSPDTVPEQTLAGDAITAKLTRARGNQAPIQGLKIATSNGWFAARPSDAENIIKIYAESFKSAAHLGALGREAQALVNRAIGSGA